MKGTVLLFIGFVIVGLLIVTGNMPNAPTLSELVSGNSKVQEFERDFNRSIDPTAWR